MTAADFAAANRRAGIVTRLAAVGVDALILFVLLRGTAWFVGAVARVLQRFAPPVDFVTVLLALAPFLVGAYHVLFWRFGGQTPGKWLLGVKVVSAGGGRVTFARAVVRLFGYLLSALPCYLGFLWIVGPRRRGWHDVLARTEVVYVARPRPPAPRRAPPFGGMSGALPSPT